MFILVDSIGGKTVLSEKIQQIDPVLKCAMLVVVVPDHHAAKYTWKKEDSSNWVNLEAETGVLYVRSSGVYKCEVSGQVYDFEVTGTVCALILLPK